MISSLYNSASSMYVLGRQQEQVANNLANINTTGHRRVQFSIAERSGVRHAKNDFGYGPEIEQKNVDFSPGRIVDTGRPLDLAITGDGFFVLEGPEGPLYTKSGRFFRDSQTGQLRGDSELPILGTGGPIRVDPTVSEIDITFAKDGGIFVNGDQVGQLEIAAFEDNQSLVPVTQTVFQQSPRTITKEPEFEISQRFHELSNVNATHELISLIIGGRQYEAIQKATRTIAESLEQSIRA